MALEDKKNKQDAVAESGQVDRSHEMRRQELHPSKTVTGAGETSHEGGLDLTDMADEFGADGSDTAALGMEDIGGTDTEMLEERARDMER